MGVLGEVTILSSGSGFRVHFILIEVVYTFV